MGATTRLLGVAASSLAALALAGAAGAPAAQAAGLGSFASLYTRGAGGWEIAVAKAGARVFLSAGRGKVEATYTVPAQRMRGDGIKARFGRLGRIAVRFRPPPSHRRRQCDLATLLDPGVFVGTIRFRGELGYTAVDARRARGLSFGSLPTACTAAEAGASASARRPAPPQIATHLAAIRKLRGGAQSLDALAYRGGRLLVYAARSERRGRMDIVRTALTPVGGENAFRATGPGRRPAYAFLAPPKPFSGSGTFREGPERSATWSGSISVWLPGAGTVPLAGPRFASSLCRRAEGERGCGLFPTVQRPLQEAIAAGGGRLR